MNTTLIPTMPPAALVKANQLFSWLEHLSAAEQDNFYTDFFEAIESALHSKNWSIVEQTIENWQATAEVLASTELTTMLTVSTNEEDWEKWDDVETKLFNSVA
jgi:hypothetical protein